MVDNCDAKWQRVLSPSETNMCVGRISLTNDSNKVKPSIHAKGTCSSLLTNKAISILRILRP